MPKVIIRIIQFGVVGFGALYTFSQGFQAGTGRQASPLIGMVVFFICIVIAGSLQANLCKLLSPKEAAAHDLQPAKRLVEMVGKSKTSESRAKTFREKVVIPAIQQVISRHPGTPEAAEAKQLLNSVGQPT